MAMFLPHNESSARQYYGNSPQRQRGRLGKAGLSRLADSNRACFFHLPRGRTPTSLRVMKAKEKKSVKEQVPFDPILFAATAPSRRATAKDRADAKERADDAVEPKDHDTMDAMVKDL
jgi:hypothetical protein